MKIALFPNLTVPHAHEVVNQTITFLQKHGIHCLAEKEVAAQFHLKEHDISQANIFISFGGDGSILRLAHRYSELNIPILGINLGHLGFMADVPTTDIESSLEDLVKGSYTLEKRIQIEGISPKGQRVLALNDIVVHRAHNPSLIELTITVNGTFVNNFEADGLIFATPNGSTAYSLAAGGPILAPNLDALVLTPICAHTISNRPIVLPSDQEVTVQYLGKNRPIEVTADGIDQFELQPNEKFTVRKSSKHFQLVRLNRHEYFAILRSKLGWAGKLRMKNG